MVKEINGLKKTTVLVEYPQGVRPEEDYEDDEGKHGSIEEYDFEVVDDSADVLIVACPFCGNEIPLRYGETCANGHIAYTIIGGEDMQ